MGNPTDDIFREMTAIPQLTVEERASLIETVHPDFRWDPAGYYGYDEPSYGAEDKEYGGR